jgi:hypothetical protein
MYRYTVWLPLDNDLAAEEMAETLASACDAAQGRPLTDEDNITYVLIWEPDEEDFDAWAKENLFRDGVRGVIVPSAYSKGPLQ